MSEPALPLVGHAQAEAEFIRALDGGRLHHAWIVEGPSGIGKARFVLRLAARLLGASGPDDNDLAVPASDPVMQKILASGHPDLKQIERGVNDKGALKQDITVEQIRSLNQFFSLKPALGGWRIGVLDSLDEMNVNGLNALLKTLEEPPARAILFLVSHATVPVLATIRSRCQTLRLNRLSEDETIRVLEMQGQEAPDQVASLVKGRPGRAESLTGTKVLAAAHAAKSVFMSNAKTNDAQLASAIQAAGEDDTTFAVFAEEVLHWLDTEAQQKPELAKAWFEVQRIIAAHRNLHMTPTQAASKLVASLQSSAALH
jgi:DNA polymerase-3 subunit delta'